jgi:hypothetical protein
MATTFDQLILTAEVGLQQAIKRRESALATVKLLHARAQHEGRSGLTDDEAAEAKASMENHTRAQADVQAQERALAELRAAKELEDANDVLLATRASDKSTEAKLPAYDRVARVGSEERTYHRGNDHGGAGFLKDILAQHLYRDPQAEQRLMRHMSEERVERGQVLTRAAGTGAFAGLTVPQYLVDMKAPAVAARRPFADICNKHALPADGMTVNISRITTATSVALQSSENAAVSETNIDDTLLTVSVQTAAGQQTISRQAIDRGTGIEETVMDDLFRRYATTLDSTLLNQATNGLTNVAQSVAYTDASPTTAELWPKFHNALANSEAALLGQARPDFAVMHSRRWYWMQSQVGTSFPFIGQPGINGNHGAENLQAKYGDGARGILPNGTVVIVDNNIGTTLGAGTEDEIYIVASDECHLWEDPGAPVFIRAEQPNAASLGVLLVLYGYFAYTFARYTNGQSKIAGTGLIAPTFA